MQIKLWGVRGSLPSPLTNDEYRDKIKYILQKAGEAGFNKDTDIDSFIEDLPDPIKYIYGGDTTCATVTSNSGKTYILDCGSGIRPIGYELMKGPCGKGKGVVDIFITHNHWDHIQGLPFFKPLYVPGNILNFYTPYKNQHDILRSQMSAPCFPAEFDETLSTKKFTMLDPAHRSPIQLEEDLVVEYYPLKHPGRSFAYRFIQGGKVFIFATDAEFTGEALEHPGRKDDNHFFHDADLLVIDSQYTLDEAFMKFDWGHTSYTMAVNCGVRWKVKELVLTHHEPAYSDEKLYQNYLAAVEHRDMCAENLPTVHFAREGMVFDL